MKPSLLIGVLVLLGAIGIGWYVQSRPFQTKTPPRTAPTTPTSYVVDQRAAFAIFTNGVFRVFTAAMYHNRSPEVYIDATNPNIIKVKKSGVTWNDFFKTLPFSLTHLCLTTGTRETFCTNGTKILRFYLNGVRKAAVLDDVIIQGDKLLVSYGNEGDDVIFQQLRRLPAPAE